MSRFKGYSIRTKYAVVVSMLIFFIALFIYDYFPSKLARREYRGTVAKAQVIAQMTGFTIRPALVFDDKKGIEEGIEAAKLNADVLYCIVVDDSGNVVAEFRRNNRLGIRELLLTVDSTISEDGLIFHSIVNINHNGQRFGTLYMGMSLEGLVHDLERSRSTTLLVSIVVLLLGVTVVFAVSTVITKNLRHMVQTVEDVAQGEFTKHANVQSHDEVGHLAESFNIMIDKLQEARAELEAVNKTLESRVDERTIALQNEIKERRKIEEHLIHVQRMETIGRLAGGVAHDFNNILGILLGHASLLRMGSMDTTDVSKSLDVINMTIQRGAALVRQLLTFARKTDTVLEPININDIILEIHSGVLGTFPKMITFDLQLAGTLPTINADHNQIHQALLNLFVNARDAMPQEGILKVCTKTLHGTELKQRFHDVKDEEYVSIEVSDNGMGMDAATRERIFEPFFTTKELGKGTGLGLAVVYGIVSNHNGYIEVHSEVGKGTTFTMYFPTIADNNLPVVDTVRRSIPGGNETILLVEDEADLLVILQIILENHGYKILKAKDGEEAIRVYYERHNEIDLIITDMGLPKLGGLEEFIALKAISPNVKVIFASGFFDPAIRAQLIHEGGSAFVQKPYEASEILIKIREALDTKIQY